MNASLCHLNSIARWKRSRSFGLKPPAFIVLQTLAASGENKWMKPSTLAIETGLSVFTVYDAISTLQKYELIAISKAEPVNASGRPSQQVQLTPQGLTLMQPHPEDPADASTTSAWGNSRL